MLLKTDYDPGCAKLFIIGRRHTTLHSGRFGQGRSRDDERIGRACIGDEEVVVEQERKRVK